jgi:hypothetical protein
MTEGIAPSCRIAILSDIHYASGAERARGLDYETRGIANPGLRALVRLYRRFVWLKDPFGHNHLLDAFVALGNSFEWVIANGDYSCNSGFIGVADEAAAQSVSECLGKLRERFGPRFRAVCGDHELGKLSFVGGQGGLRLASWERATSELGIEPFWRAAVGNYLLVGVTSTLIALPVFEPDALPSELPRWEDLRAQHLDQVRSVFLGLKPEQRVILFCHDPTALPFLRREVAIREKLPQVEATVIGHLHTNLVLWKSRVLSGIPQIKWFGHTTKRLTAALHEARHWREFQIRLCPSLAGIELTQRGGFLTVDLGLSARAAAQFRFHRLRRGKPRRV